MVTHRVWVRGINPKPKHLITNFCTHPINNHHFITQLQIDLADWERSDRVQSIVGLKKLLINDVGLE